MSNHFSHCVVAVAAGVALLLVLGIEASSLLYAGVFLACPLMMFFMMRGMMAVGHGAEREQVDTDRRASGRTP